MYEYPNGIKTVEQAMQAVVRDTAEKVARPGDIIDKTWIHEQAEAALEEIRTILTAELSTLFDRDGVAQDWNEALEMAICLVEGDLP